MKCKICGGEGQFRIRSYNLTLCRDCFMRRLHRRVEETVHRYRLFRKEEELFVIRWEGNSRALSALLSEMGYRVRDVESEDEIPSDGVVVKGTLLEDAVANALWQILTWDIRDDILPSYIENGRKVVKPLCLLIEEELAIYKEIKGIDEEFPKDNVKEKLRTLGISSIGFWLSFYKSLVKDLTYRQNLLLIINTP
ncbi:MAG: hypothetical protein ACPLSK_00160 [bacterium]